MNSIQATLASDEFFLNLGSILLALCQPFLDPRSSKLTKIDPRYCIAMVTVDTMAQEDTTVHLRGLQAETKLCVAESEGRNMLQALTTASRNRSLLDITGVQKFVS